MKQICLALASSLLLSACVGGSLRNHKDIEEYPLREATKAEGAALKKCLLAARYYQELRKEKGEEPYKRAADIPSKKYCADYKLSLNDTAEGYEITAELIDDDQTVRWSVGEDGVMEEHLDPGYDDEMEF